MSKFLNIDGLSHLINIVKTKFQTIHNKIISNQAIVETTMGAKYYNLLNPNDFYMTNTNGATITSNGDGTYNLSGVTTGTADYYHTSSGVFTSMFGLEVGKTYTITSGNDELIRIDYSTNGTSWDNGEDGVGLVINIRSVATFTIPNNCVGLFIRFRSVFNRNLSGITLSPMIRLSSIEKNTYIPYHKDLQTQINDIQSNVDNINKLSYLGDPILLESGQDLDGLVNPGFYHSPNGTISQSLLNAPSDIGYSGSVLVRVLQRNIYQIWISANFAHNSDSTNKTGLYIRNCSENASIWSEWFSLL